jgi:hypothetical protein
VSDDLTRTGAKLLRRIRLTGSLHRSDLAGPRVEEVLAVHEAVQAELQSTEQGNS